MKNIEAIIDGSFRHEVIEAMPRALYLQECGLNPSSLKKPSPKHVRHAYENNGKETDAMRLGTAVHVLCWEPNRWHTSVAVYDGKRDDRIEKWRQFQADNEGKTIITPKQYDEALTIGQSLIEDPLVFQLAQTGVGEVAVFTEECGMQCRGQLDWINTDLGILCDLKVVNSIDARMFGNAVIRYGWDISMACYRRWFERESGKRIRSVKFISVESTAPYDVAVVSVPEPVLDSAWDRAIASIRRVKECVESGVWPGIANGKEVDLYVPAYAMGEDEVVSYE